jgi:hypothetical protein
VKKASQDPRRLADLPQLPFSDALRQRILTAARKQADDGRIKRRYRVWVGYSLAAAAGLGVAVIGVVGVLSVRNTNQAGRAFMSASSSNDRVAANASGLSATMASASGFVLQPAPLQVLNVWLGTDASHPRGSVVYARVFNGGKVPIGRYDVIGVLGFTPGADANDILGYAHLTLTNGPDVPVPPGGTGVWSFHPVGVPHNASGALSEVPHLWFLQPAPDATADTLEKGAHGAANPASGQASVASRADSTNHRETAGRIIWHTVGPTTIRLQHVHATPGKARGSVHVTAQLVNASLQPLDLRGYWAILWFEGGGVQHWTDPGAIRFISPLGDAEGTSSSVAPGGTVALYFPLLGPTTDYSRLTPHIAIIRR